MITIVLLLLIINCKGEEWNCIPKGTKYSEGFESLIEGIDCSLTNEQRYYIDKTFEIDTDETIIFHTVYFNGEIELKDDYIFKSFNTFFLENSRFTTAHTQSFLKQTTIETNVVVETDDFVQFGGHLTIEDKQLNHPPIIAWNTSLFHLFQVMTDYESFEVSETTGYSQCYDIISLHSVDILNVLGVNHHQIYEKDFPYKMTDGILYAFANKQLLRFCPNNTFFSIFQ